MTEPLARILIADDEADIRALLQRYLGAQGYAVRTVEGAAPLGRLLARVELYAVITGDRTWRFVQVFWVAPAMGFF